MKISHDSLFFAALRYRRLFVHGESRQKHTPLDIPHPEARYLDAINLSVIPVVGNFRAETGQVGYVAL